MEPAERRERILAKAAALFGARGYHETSISDIIEAADIARGTFYLYFQNKRAIFEELLDRLVAHIRSQIRVVDLSAEAPAREQILGNIVRVLDVLTADRPLLSILLEGAVGLDKGFDEKLDDFYGNTVRIIESSLSLGQKMGIVRSCDANIVARAAIGALKEVLLGILKAKQDEKDLERVAAEILDLFFRGVLARGVSLP